LHGAGQLEIELSRNSGQLTMARY